MVFVSLLFFAVVCVMKYLIVGHSWVRRLQPFRNLLPNGAVLLGVGGATFRSAIPLLHSFVERPETATDPPFAVFVLLGGNEIHRARTYADADAVIQGCIDFCKCIRDLLPGVLIAVSQVEDRYHVGPGDIVDDHRRLGNRYNTWLNKWQRKDGLVTIKGSRVLSCPEVFLVDGVHLNELGNSRLCQRLTYSIWKMWGLKQDKA